MAKKNATGTKLPKPRRQDIVQCLSVARWDIQQEFESVNSISEAEQEKLAENALRKAGVLKAALALKEAFSPPPNYLPTGESFLISLLNKFAIKDTPIYLDFAKDLPARHAKMEEFRTLLDARFRELATQIEIRTTTVEESLALIESFRNEFKDPFKDLRKTEGSDF